MPGEQRNPLRFKSCQEGGEGFEGDTHFTSSSSLSFCLCEAQDRMKSYSSYYIGPVHLSLFTITLFITLVCFLLPSAVELFTFLCFQYICNDSTIEFKLIWAQTQGGRDKEGAERPWKREERGDRKSEACKRIWQAGGEKVRVHVCVADPSVNLDLSSAPHK